MSARDHFLLKECEPISYCINPRNNCTSCLNIPFLYPRLASPLEEIKKAIVKLHPRFRSSAAFFPLDGQAGMWTAPGCPMADSAEDSHFLLLGEKVWLASVQADKRGDRLKIIRLKGFKSSSDEEISFQAEGRKVFVCLKKRVYHAVSTKSWFVDLEDEEIPFLEDISPFGPEPQLHSCDAGDEFHKLDLIEAALDPLRVSIVAPTETGLLRFEAVRAKSYQTISMESRNKRLKIHFRWDLQCDIARKDLVTRPRKDAIGRLIFFTPEGFLFFCRQTEILLLSPDLETVARRLMTTFAGEFQIFFLIKNGEKYVNALTERKRAEKMERLMVYGILGFRRFS